MKSERLCKCGCGGSMEEFDRRRQFLPECADERNRRQLRESSRAHYAKNRTSIKEYRPSIKDHRRAAPRPEVFQAPKGKTITADDVEAAMKWGWCPRHPDRKAVALGLCAECGRKHPC